MSTAAVNPKGPRTAKPSFDAGAWASAYLDSTVGHKLLVAATGLALVGFVVFHMIGNLKIFNGRDAINGYAYFLKHELGAFLWAARLGLLATFVLHIVLVVRLKAKSAAARPAGYVYQRSAQASLASVTMMWTGVVTLAFVAFHLAHYTFGFVAGVEDPKTGMMMNYLDLHQTLSDGTKRHDVYNMTVAGFRSPVLSGIYLAAQVLLAGHLAHGIQSTVQTLGLKGTRFAPVWTAVGYGTAAAVLVGNTAIVLAVWSGFLPYVWDR